jgi:hypothetical protein
MSLTNYSGIVDMFDHGIRTAIGGAYPGEYVVQVDPVGQMGGSYTTIPTKANTIVHLEVNQDAVIGLDSEGKEIHVSLESTQSGVNFTSYAYKDGVRYEYNSTPVGGTTSWSGNNFLMSWGVDVGFYNKITREAVYEAGVFDHWEYNRFETSIAAIPSYVTPGEIYPKPIPVQITDEAEIPYLIGSYTGLVQSGAAENQYIDATYSFFEDVVIEEQDSDTPDDTSTDKGGAWFSTVNEGTPDGHLPRISVLSTGMISIYRPTPQQLTSITSWLWSDSFTAACLKNYASPFENIIGLFQSRISPQAAGSTFRIANLDSNIPINRVYNQYRSIDCGTKHITPYYNNFADYNGYRVFKLFLPYYGMVDLDTDEFMGHSGGDINVKYHIDFLTGTASIQVRLKRSGSDGAWHGIRNYTGNIYASIPYSGTNMLNYYVQSLSSAASIIGGAMSKNPSMIAQGVEGMLTASPDYGGSKGMAGNSGVISPVQCPVLLECLPLRAMPDYYGKYLGLPLFKYRRLSEVSGYTEVSNVRLNIRSASSEEVEEIKRLLKEGVIL